MASARTIFGQNIRRWRQKRGLSQEALAHDAGLHRTYLGRVELGKVNVSIDNIEKIARALAVDIAKLFAP